MMKVRDFFCFFCCLLLLVYAVQDFTRILPVPVKTGVDPLVVKTVRILTVAGAPEKRIPELSNAIVMVSRAKDVSPAFIIALIKTESTFDKNAKSPKGYKGEMQTPWSCEFSDTNISYGVNIYLDKLKMAKGDMLRALAMYKGGNTPPPAAWTQAQHTYNLYKQLARL